MHILATFYDDEDGYTTIIDTDKLEADLKKEVENSVKDNPFAIFKSEYHYNCIMDGAVDTSLKDKSIFPMNVVAAIDVHLE